MALIIPPTALGDPPTFDEFTLGANLIGGYLQITGNPAEVEILYGRYGAQDSVEPQILPLGSYRVDRSPAGIPLAGLRARNATAGLGSVLGGYFWTESDPTISFIGLASSQAVGAVLIPVVDVAEFHALTPSDGQVVALDWGVNLRWLFSWDAGASLWRFMGGPPLYNEVVTEQSPASTGTYISLATSGPTITLPIAADYQVDLGCQIRNASGQTVRMSYDIGATGAVDADAVRSTIGTEQAQMNIMRRREKTIAADGTVLLARYKSSSVTPGISDRWISAVPVTAPA